MNNREAFEEWAESEGLSATKDSEDGYTSGFTDLSWMAWKKATERAATICDSQHDRALTSSGAHRADCCAVRIREGNE